MSEIEEIKERLENASGEHGWFVMHDTDISYEEPPGSCDLWQVCVINYVNDAQFVGHAKDDIKYLLSLIDKYEDVLNQITENSSDAKARKIARDYLKKDQKNRSDH